MLCPKCHRPLAEEDDGLYICCADAPLQWQCGECGKVSEGFAFPYGRCPQCSGPLALCSEDKSIAADEVQALNAVRMAFEIELGGRAFYRSAAADCLKMASGNPNAASSRRAAPLPMFGVSANRSQPVSSSRSIAAADRGAPQRGLVTRSPTLTVSLISRISP